MGEFKNILYFSQVRCGRLRNTTELEILTRMIQMFDGLTFLLVHRKTARELQCQSLACANRIELRCSLSTENNKNCHSVRLPFSKHPSASLKDHQKLIWCE